jgi:CheY-like chemotaxis protein
MASSQKLPAPRGRVLVVDDEPAVRAILNDFLGQLDFEVYTAPDGAAALQAFHAQHFDLILVDFQMPGITGLEVAAEMRKTNQHLPIALISGTVNAVEADCITQAGITRTFQKPFRLEELCAWIKSLHL